MSSYECRRNTAKGTVSHRVRFRLNGANKAITFDTQAQARAWQAVLDSVGPARAVAMLDEAAHPASARTVLDQVRHYAEHQPGITDGTRRRYLHLADSPAFAPLGEILLADLTRDDVAAWVRGMSDVKPKTRKNRHTLLSATLERAERDGLVVRNVAKGVRTGSGDELAAEMVFLEPEEIAAFVGLVRPAYQHFVAFLPGTGLRFGEATALRVGDVDVRHGTITVQQAWKDTAGQGHRLGLPKSKKSRRTISVDGPILDLIRPKLDGRAPDEFIFLNTRGGPIRSGSFHLRVWQPAVRAFVAAGSHKRPRVHDMRHTFASLMLRRGERLDVVSRHLGHETIKTTIDFYGHLARSDFEQLARTASEVMGPALAVVEGRREITAG